MPKLPVLSGRELIDVLVKAGFSEVRQKGSHVSLRKIGEYGTIGCVVPLHKELATGTLRGILRQAQISPEQLIQIVKNS
jgi:predicted RNA binding protein YcfA (HicA-like mRNA interferase family)